MKRFPFDEDVDGFSVVHLLSIRRLSTESYIPSVAVFVIFQHRWLNAPCYRTSPAPTTMNCSTTDPSSIGSNASEWACSIFFTISSLRLPESRTGFLYKGVLVSRR